MRTLPDHPSLDYLRQEAKDLLAALRESRPDATLAEAQRTLANQYAFHAWTDLKAEVERRRVNMPAADPALAQAFIAAFGLGSLTGGMLPVAHGLSGRSWSLTTGRGRFHVRPVLNWIDEAQAERGERVRVAAAEAGVASPLPIRGPDGRLIASVNGSSWRCYVWMDLGPGQSCPPRLSVARRMGAALAKIHNGSLEPGGTLQPWFTYRRAIEEWKALIARARQADTDWADELEKALPNIERLTRVPVAMPATDPILSIGDLQLENVRLGADGNLVITFWDFASVTHPAWELAGVVHAWSEVGQVWPSVARAIVDGYASVRDVPVLDLSSFSAAISGWLNYAHGQMCGAIGDLGGDGWEQRERYARETRALLAQPLTVESLELLLKAMLEAC
jgi:Ser/Thr protein kinase RdoA (MazF antagonist)